MSRIGSILTSKCPRCEEGDIFEHSGNIFLLKLPKMHTNCPVCSHRFEKEPGYYWGAMFISYALIVAELIASYLLCRLIFNDPFDFRIVIISLVIVSLLSLTNFRYSRILWMYIFDSKKR